MDLDAYAGRYNGETRAQRLMLISQVVEDESTVSQAFRLLETQLKADGNVRLYAQVFGQQQLAALQHGQSSSEASKQVECARSSGYGYLRRVPPASMYDEEWAHTAENNNSNARAQLLERLKSANAQLHKEAIRMAYIVLAQHDSKTGDLSSALGNLVRATDYCSSHTQTAHLSLLVLETALAIGEYSHVRDYAIKVELTLGSTPVHEMSGHSTGSSYAEVSVKVKLASGLEKLAKGDYSNAADTFTNVILTTSSTMWEWKSVISAEDVALYASLLSLAKQSRTAIVQLSEHAEALELVPSMREILTHFARADYQQCCAAFPTNGSPSDTSALTVGSVPPTADLFLHKHWPVLCGMIRERCMLEYIKPYQSIRLENMATAFGTTADDLEEVLASLIGRGLVPDAARIDARERILTKRDVIDVSVASIIESRRLHHSIAKMEGRIMDDTQALLVRLSCLEHNLKIKSKDKRRGSRRGPETSGADNISDDDSSAGAAAGPSLDDMMGFDDDGHTPMDIEMMNPQQY